MLSRWIILFLLIVCGYGFNIDVDQVIVKKSDKGSLFGMSVTPHLIQSSKETRMLVGAPLTNTSKDKTMQPTGAIYACPLSTKNDDCKLVPITFGRLWRTHNQMLGLSTMSATPFGGSKVFTCAPRAALASAFTGAPTYVGHCQVVNNDLQGSKEIIMGGCGTSRSYALSKFCLRGMSVSTNEQNDVLIGAPYESNSEKSPNFGTVLYSDPTRYKMTSGSMTDNFLSNIKSTTGPTYFGWSVVMGRIYAGSKTTYVAGGPVVPVSADKIANFSKLDQSQIGAGLVITFIVKEKDKTVPVQQLVGEQFASRFGHSVLLIDINNDGWDDLLVGAPEFRSEKDSTPYGAVYLYINDKGKELKLRQVIRAPKMSAGTCRRKHCNRARFGFALSNLKDINLDKYPDVGVSAPGEGNGVIYIYHGSPDGRLAAPVQKLAYDGLKNLGYALGAGMDLDNNGYPDLVAGAWGSDSAAVFRTRPILKVEVQVKFTVSPLKPELITNAWTCPNLTKYYCFKMDVEFEYKPARDGDKTDRPIPGSLHLLVDPLYGKKSRVTFNQGYMSNEENTTVTFKAEKSKKTYRLYIKKEEIIDKMNPIKFNISWSLGLKAPPRLSGSTLPQISDYPVYDKNNNFKIFELKWKNDCPATGCTSDLELTVKSSLAREEDPASPAKFVYYIGDSKVIWMNFTLRNHEGLAHYVQFTFEKLSDILVDSSTCNCINSEALICKFRDPIRSGKTATCDLQLRTGTKEFGKYLNFSAYVSTASRNLNRYPTRLKFQAAVKLQASIHLTSSTNPSQIFVSKTTVIGASAIKHEKKIGDKRIKVNFKLENRLKSTMKSSTLTIWWPFEVAGDPQEPHGKYLLYLLKKPKVEASELNKVECDKEALKRLVNPLGVRILDSEEASNKSFAMRYRRRAAYQAIPIPSPIPANAGYELCSVNKSARCIPIVCRIPFLGKNFGPVSISFVARLWIHTLVEDFKEDQSRPIVIAASWKLGDNQSVSLLNGSVTDTQTTLNAVNVMERKAKPPKMFPLIIAAAVVGGIILFGCLVIILWKCNFFKRTNMRQKRMEMLRQSQMQRS